MSDVVMTFTVKLDCNEFRGFTANFHKLFATIHNEFGLIGENYNVILFVCLFVYSRLSNFSAIRRLSLLPMTGLQI
jgi:hypothetical protein